MSKIRSKVCLGNYLEKHICRLLWHARVDSKLIPVSNIKLKNMISLLIRFLSLWQNTWDYQFKKRKYLLCSSCGVVWACVGKVHHGGRPGWRRLLTFWWKEAKREQEGLEFQDLPQGHASVMGSSGPHWFKVPPPPITPRAGDQSFNAWTFEDIFKPQWTWAEMNLYIMLKGGNFQTCPQRQNPQREDLKSY